MVPVIDRMLPNVIAAIIITAADMAISGEAPSMPIDDNWPFHNNLTHSINAMAPTVTIEFIVNTMPV